MRPGLLPALVSLCLISSGHADVLGCDDPKAENYNTKGVTDPNHCIYPPTLYSPDPEASNYVEGARDLFHCAVSHTGLQPSLTHVAIHLGRTLRMLRPTHMWVRSLCACSLSGVWRSMHPSGMRI